MAWRAPLTKTERRAFLSRGRRSKRNGRVVLLEEWQGRGRVRSRRPGVRQRKGPRRDREPEEGRCGMKMQQFISVGVELSCEYLVAVK